jgi:hypothetical protein
MDAEHRRLQVTGTPTSIGSTTAWSTDQIAQT